MSVQRLFYRMPSNKNSYFIDNVQEYKSTQLLGYWNDYPLLVTVKINYSTKR